MRALNKSIVRTLGLAASALLLAGCGGGGDGGFGGRPIITVDISADRTSLPANRSGFVANPGNQYTNTMTVQVSQEGRLFPAESVAVDLFSPDGTGALYYLDGDPEHEVCEEDENGVEVCVPAAFRRLVFEETSGIINFHFSSGPDTGSARIVASVSDPTTGQVVSDDIQIIVGSGDNTELPASFNLISRPEQLYIRGLGRTDVGSFELELVDDGSFPIPDDFGHNNVQVELLSSRPNGGEFLSASGAGGATTGQTVRTFSRNGLVQFAINSGDTPGTVLLRAIADRADNDVDNGIQSPVIDIIETTIGSGSVKSLSFTGPFAGAVTNYFNFIQIDDDEFIGGGVYNRQLSIIAADEFGNPPVVGTPVSLRLVDSPASGYPDEGRGEFLITGTDGNISEGGSLFTTLTPLPTTTNPPCPAVNGILVYDGARPYQSGGKIVTGFNPPSTLSLNNAFASTADTGFTVPYVVGCAPHSGNVDATVILDANGVGTFFMRYPVNQIGRNFILTAEADGGRVGTVMRHWYLGQSQSALLTGDIGGTAPDEAGNVVLNDFEEIDGVIYGSGSAVVRLFLQDGGIVNGEFSGGEPLPAELIGTKVVITNPAIEGFAEAQDALDAAQQAVDACVDDPITPENECLEVEVALDAAQVEIDRILAQLANPPTIEITPEVIRTGANGIVDVTISADRFSPGSTAVIAFSTVGPTTTEANPILSNTWFVTVVAPGGDGGGGEEE